MFTDQVNPTSIKLYSIQNKVAHLGSKYLQYNLRPQSYLLELRAFLISYILMQVKKVISLKY